MVAGFVPAILQILWNVWNIRFFMIMSLSVQLVLTVAAPMRRKSSNVMLISAVWSAYFLADWTAIFAFGLISNAGCQKHPSDVEVTGNLQALWASFLLIHLGGPDTITAFSLEDNALWFRHLVGLITQIFAFLYIFVKTLPDNKLMAPTILVSAAGVIKYGERTRVLYMASLKMFKKSSVMPPNQPDGVNLPSAGQDEEANSKEKLKTVFHFYHILQSLIVDVMPNHLQRLESREFFLKQDAYPVFEMIVTELNLLYEALYTKIAAVNSSWGARIRNIAYYMSVTALVLFCLNKKDGLQSVDVRITYALLAGVIASDTSSEIMLALSKWISNKPRNLGQQILASNKVVPETDACWVDVAAPFLVALAIGVSEEIGKMRYTSKIPVPDGIWKYTFSVLHGRASGTDDPNKAREIYEARGELVLRDRSDELKRYVTEFEYDQSILLWHIATEICYNTDRNLNKDDENVKFGKILSNYMIYLLVKQPEMMSAVVDIFDKRYQVTCGELKRLKERVRAVTLEEFCLKVLEGYGTGIEPAHQDGNAGASVLINLCSLATILLQNERKWEILCMVWVELLSYAAGHCRVDSHAQQLSKGGEFVTCVWLMTAYFGIGSRFPKH